jgi:hypothetical protein
MASKDSPSSRRERRTDSAKFVAAYQVVISLSEGSGQAPEEDEILILRLEERQGFIQQTLTRRAIQRFGPAYRIQLGRAEPESSIRTSVLLGISYPVRAGAAVVEELRRFAGDIELVIADALAPPPPPDPPLPPISVVAELDEMSVAETPTERAAWDRVAPILGVIGTSIGVLGFVTFVGGAIDWARFHAAGLPQEEALSVIPTQDLVVVGARTLVPAVLWGLLATALYLLFRIIVGRREQRLPNPADRTVVERYGDTVRALTLTAFVSVFEVLAFAITLKAPGRLQYLVFIGLGLLMASLTYSIARITDRFVYLAVTIFGALSIFLAGVGYARERTTPELRGAAVVRNNKKATIGFFIAESGSRVYLGRIALEKGKKIDADANRLLGIEKKEITDLAIGPPKAPPKAKMQAEELADELCELEIPASSPPADLRCWSRPAGQ